MQIIGQLKLLVIEDMIEDYQLLVAGLEDLKIQSVQAKDLEQMKRKINEEKFDAILLDLCIGETQGIDTITEAQKILSESEINRNCPIVILSGLNDFSIIKKALKMGVKDYLCKGEFAATELKRALSFATVTNELPKRSEKRFPRFW